MVLERGNLSARAPVLVRNIGSEEIMNSIIYLVGLVVIVMAILSFVGLR